MPIPPHRYPIVVDWGDHRNAIVCRAHGDVGLSRSITSLDAGHVSHEAGLQTIWRYARSNKQWHLQLALAYLVPHLLLVRVRYRRCCILDDVSLRSLQARKHAAMTIAKTSLASTAP